MNCRLPTIVLATGLPVLIASALCALLVTCQLVPAQEPINEGETKKTIEKAEAAASKTDTKTKPTAENAENQSSTPETIKEARVRARILHEAFSGALQVMHRDFFREDEKLTLPSRSLEDVFAEMSEAHNIKLRWLAVNAQPMTIAHKPSNEFDNAVVKALSAGAKEFEATQGSTFQYAGSIRLSASCVKCHVRNRTSNDEKKAALIITMPLKSKN